MQIHITSVSGHSVHFIFKTCQIVAGTSMISRFHEFLNQIFDRVLRFGPTVRWRRRVRGGVQSTTTINARGKSSGDVRGSYSICFCILKYTAGLSNSIQWQRPVDITLVFASLITWFSHKYAMVDSKEGQCISHLILHHTKYMNDASKCRR